MTGLKIKILISVLALSLLAGCGDGGSSANDPKPSEADSISAEDSSIREDVRFEEGYYRIKADTALDDGSGNAISYNNEKIAYGVPDPEHGRLKLSFPCQTGTNDLNEAQYTNRDFYTKDSEAVSLLTVDEVRQAAVDYALAMSEKPKQTYVLSGELVTEDETRSDCSGMTELAYLSVGICLEHYADAQANGGERMQTVFDNLESEGERNGTPVYRIKDEKARVDYSKLQKGDLLFFLCATNSSSDNNLYTDNGIGHVAMYIGDGKMVHFTADYGISNKPCRTEQLIDYESRVLKVVRAVRYIF